MTFFTETCFEKYRFYSMSNKIYISDLVDDLEETVEASFHNHSGINVTASLAQALKILDEINSRNFLEQKNAADVEHE